LQLLVPGQEIARTCDTPKGGCGMGLLLGAIEYQDVARWRWRLTGPGGGFLADHEVKLDRAVAEYEGFENLGAFVRHHTDPDDPVGSELAAVRRVGEWLGREVLGPVGRAMVEEGPVTVRVRVPAGAEELLYRPLELGHVGGRPLALQDVSLILEAGGGEAPAKRAVGDRLRMLAVFSLPTGHSPLGLRAERRVGLPRTRTRAPGPSRRHVALVRNYSAMLDRPSLVRRHPHRRLRRRDGHLPPQDLLGASGCGRCRCAAGVLEHQPAVGLR
jgi:hypothetical protein